MGVYLIYLEEENHIGFCCDICSGSVMVRTGNGFDELGFSRLFLGIAIGVASFTVPLYIAEIAPAKSRGRLVSMFQLMVTIGILLSYMSDTFGLMKTSWIVGDGCFGQVSYRLWYYW